MKRKEGFVIVTVVGLWMFAGTATSALPNRAQSCGDFGVFLKRFETDQVYQLAHTKWPLHIANLSLCDEREQPRIHGKSGKPYPKDWCSADVPRERFKNGVFLIRSLRERSHIREVVKVGGDRVSVLHACDAEHRNVCANYWTRYYFSRDGEGCWQLEREQQRTE